MVAVELVGAGRRLARKRKGTFADTANMTRRSHAVRRWSGVALATFVAVIFIGTDADARPRARKTRTLSMTATAYCDGGETRSGTLATTGTVAADPRVLPLGTTIRVTGLRSRHPQVFTVADTGAAVKGRTIDIFIRDCAGAKTFGRRRVQVTILGLRKEHS
jgi:3D (Asp-Asp-Asp) domain-containing protein